MRKKAVYPFFLVLLAMVVLLSACGNTQEPQGTANGVQYSAAGEFPIVEDDTVELTVWAILSSEISDYATNSQSVWYEEYSGVKVKWINVPSHGWADAFQLSVMNGDYPDIYLYDFSSSEVDICAEYDAIIPLNDLIEEHCPNIRAYLNSHEDVKQAITNPDGNIYTLFTESYNSSAYTQKLWVNREWLSQYTAATDKGMPTTTAEFEDMLQYFKDHDMNGNGDPSDEIPYMGKSGVDGVYGIADAFVPCNSSVEGFGCVVDPDGSTEFAYNTDEFRQALQYMNGLYSKGLFSDQTFTISDNERYNYTSGGQKKVTVGVVTAVNANEIVQLGNSDMDYTDYVAIPPLEGPDGVRSIVTVGEQTIGLRNAITTSCQYPEIAAKWLDYWYSEEGRLWSVNGGLEGVHWDYAENGSSEKIVVHKEGIDIYNNFRWAGRGVAYMLSKEDFAHMDQKSLGNDANLATFTANEVYSEYAVTSGWPPIVWVTDELETAATEYSELCSLIKNYVTQSYTDFILGRKDVHDDAQWSAYVTELEKLGVDRFVELVELYASNG